MVTSMDEQRKILNKAVNEGKLSENGRKIRLEFGSDIMRVINSLDNFLSRQKSQIETYEENKLKDFRNLLVMIREE